MMKAVKPWDELSRAEKIKHIFDYPGSMRNSQAKDLWGPEASGYYEHTSIFLLLHLGKRS